MSEHVEIVQRAEEAVRRGDAEALIGLCTDDVLRSAALASVRLSG